MSNCHCGSGLNFSECCAPYLEGKIKAPTAEALMRARYSAFVTHNIDYLIDTHHSDTKSDLSREDIDSWSKNSDWLSLEIRSTEAGSINDTEGKVEFIASYLISGKRHDHHELSDFKKEGDSWYFYDGEMLSSQQLVRTGPKVGRNDPCPCGSGKKYKKCCLAK